MGRLTYESIGQPLRNRTNIVVSESNSISNISGVITTNTIENAIKIAKEKDNEIFIIGGEKIFSKTISLADRLYLTVVDDEPDADTFFPDYSEFKKIVIEEHHPEHKPSYTYVTLDR